MRHWIDCDSVHGLIVLPRANQILFVYSVLEPLFGCLSKGSGVVEYFLHLGILAVDGSRVLQVEKLHETEVFQLFSLVLEKGVVEDTIAFRPHLEKLWDQKYRIAISILANALIVLAEELHDGVEEVGADLGDGDRTVLKIGALTALEIVAGLMLLFLYSLFDVLLQFLSHLSRQMPIKTQSFLLREGLGTGTYSCAIQGASNSLI